MPSTFTVTNVLDGGLGSFRQAILSANANPGADVIAFDIAGGGVQTIQPASALPAITGPVTIDGYTQPGASPNTNPTGMGLNAVLTIQLNGSAAGATANGLHVTGGSSTIRGLAINGFGRNGILLSGANGNRIQGNFIGTDVAGVAGLGNGWDGIRIEVSDLNTIGTDGDGVDDAAERNLLSGNGLVGPDLTFGGSGVGMDGGAGQNVVAGNLIGTNVGGTAVIANRFSGVFVVGSSSNRIGTNGDGVADADERNVILGPFTAVRMQSSTFNVVAGNFIGLNVTGTAALASGGDGNVTLQGSSSNRIGSNGDGVADADERNIIAGAVEENVLLRFGARNNLVAGNYIGTDATGSVALGGDIGVSVRGDSTGNTIGGTASGARNVISGNRANGIALGAGGTGTVVRGNYIGTNAAGTVAIPNGLDGILIQDRGNSIGGTPAGSGNVISGNGQFGIHLSGAAATLNIIRGNLIGLDATGAAALGNTNDGIRISGPANTIGGTAVGSGNVISGNGDGIEINGSAATGNIVHGNFIGTDATGTLALGNRFRGVLVNGAPSNRIGTNGDGVADAAERNVIRSNGLAGVLVFGAGGTGNSIRGNAIFANAGLGIDLGNNGITLNDPLDADNGPNQLQNFPVLTGATTGAATRVVGHLNSRADTTFTLDFYASTAPDPSGYGEGQRYLGAATVTTDASGHVAFDLTLSAASALGETITATATDPLNNTSEFSGNRAPVADAGGPYSVPEGGSVQLSAAGTTDPDQNPTTLLYEWDLDGDGVYGESGAAAARGDESGISPIFSAAALDGPTTVTIGLRVTDESGGIATDTATIAVANVAPTATAVGPDSGVRGQTLSYTGSFTDPGVADTHTVTWEVRDSGNAIVASGGTSTFSFTPTADGNYTVIFTVTDDDDDIGTASIALTVHVWQLQVDPCDASRTAIAVGGTPGNDHIVVEPGAVAGQLAVTLNGVVLGDAFAPTGRLLLYGQAGDDNIQVAGSITLPAWLYGGAGDDRLKGGAGHDVLLGGLGADLLVGGGGRDLLIGGMGADRIVGNGDDDILIAGFTAYDENVTALCAIMCEWTSARDFATRRANLNGGGTGERLNGDHFLSYSRGIVIEDADADVLTGSSAEEQDWFCFDAGKDRATDLKDAAFAGDLDFING